MNCTVSYRSTRLSDSQRRCRRESSRPYCNDLSPYLALGRQAFTLIELLLALVLIGILATMAIPSYMKAIDNANVAHAIGDVRALSTELMSYGDGSDPPASLDDIGRAGTLDPWGAPYVYLNLAGGKGRGAARKDKFLVPLNTDFDLYSKGKDGASVSPLTSPASHDDIVRANNGGYVGLAEKY
jgi:general secretion pathway protein G